MAFSKSPEAVLTKNKHMTQDERIARASLYLAARKALKWTYEEMSCAYGVSIAVVHREEKWLSSFIDSSYALELNLLVAQIAFNIKERTNES